MPNATNKVGKRSRRISERKLLQLGRAHFAMDFPNPRWVGCPTAANLKLLAEQPGIADDLVLNHISFCSPCFAATAGFLRALRKGVLHKKLDVFM